MRVNIFFVRDVGVIVIVELKRRIASICILGVVIGKLSHQKELNPIILFIIDKGSEVGFHCTVLPHGLAISLNVKSNRESCFDPKEVV